MVRFVVHAIALLVLCFCIVVPQAAAAGTLQTMQGIGVADLHPGQPMDPAIPTPADHFGFELGARPIRHAEVIAYFQALDAASPRARLQTYSHTHEGRELVYLAVSDPETVADLDGFRARHAANLDPRLDDSAAARTQSAESFRDTKAVAWIAYGIHGDELSSVDAAAAVAYALVAGEGGRVEQLRKELLILIDPIENPDGRERYLAMTTAFAHATPSSDAEDLSHTALWPWGRGNHYLFDLNRDWFSMVQPESARSAVIAGWNPQLMVDSHEMGGDSTYLFSPPRHPFNPFLPDSHAKWGQKFGNDQAKGLDARGFDYFTREWNEEFFPGYGSSWASYRGAIGILYEMARTTGKQFKRADGVLRTFAQAVEQHTASSMANLGTLLENRQQILQDFVADRRRFLKSIGGDQPAAFVLPERRHPERTRALVAQLKGQGIEVERHAEPSSAFAGPLRDLRSDRARSDSIGPGWVVRVDQPAGPMVRVLMDPHIPMDAKFLREQREYIERGKGSRLYDTTAWSLPLLYDVEAYWSSSRPASAGDSELDPLSLNRGEFVGAAEAGTVYGYALNGTSDRSLEALVDLYAQGIEVRIAERPFTVDGRKFDRGSLVVRTEGQAETVTDLGDRMRRLAEKHQVAVQSLSTAKASEGPDLGGSHFRPLQAPRIGVWAGWPVSPTDYGALWHRLDTMGVRFNALDLGGWARVDLRRYNVLIFPDSFAGYQAVFGDGGAEQLRNWVEGGGTAIGVGAGAAYLADEEIQLTRTRLRAQALDRFPSVVLGPDAVLTEQGRRFRGIGLRPAAAEAESDESNSKSAAPRTRKKKQDPAATAGKQHRSPYDVAPMIGSGARPFVAGVDLGTPAEMIPVNLADWVKPALAPGQAEPTPEDLAAADARLRGFRPEGAFVRLELDRENWLTWGAGSDDTSSSATMAALVQSADTLVADAPVQVPARFASPEQLHLGGLLWPEAAGRLSHTAYLTRESKGRGQVILFLNPPIFRGWTVGTRRLLLNAVLLGPGLGTQGSRPW